MNVHAGSSRTAKGERTRQAILSAALRLFARRSYAAVSVPDLGREAGVSAATLYLYFSGKKELLNTVYRDAKNLLMFSVIDELKSGTKTSRERFAAVWRGIGRYVANDPDGVAFLDLHHRGDYLNEENSSFEVLSLQLFADLLLEARDKNEIKDIDPAVLIVIVWGTWVGLVNAARHAHLTLDDKTIADAERACWDAVAVHPPSPLP